MNPDSASARPRVVSIDALRGLVMFTMIFVNDLAGVSPDIVPWWLRHFRADGNGMTFVDLVFPAFLFTVGLSIPLSLGPRLERDRSTWPSLRHIVARTLSLLLIGILMVHETPDTERMGWSGTLWATLLYVGAILAFARLPSLPRLSRSFQLAGFALLAFLAFSFRGADGHRIISLQPFSLHTSWYGILGLIGWAYLVTALVFLAFRTRRTALLGCMALLLCLYPAARGGAFDHFWLNDMVGIGSTLGSLPAISVAGLLLAAMLVSPDAASLATRARFTGLFVAGCTAGALLLHPLYGINKNAATPSWCLWACAITATLWFGCHLLADVRPTGPVMPVLARAGSNVLLAYLLSNLLPSLLDLLHLGDLYARLGNTCLACGIGRSLAAAALILTASTLFNRAGLRLKL